LVQSVSDNPEIDRTVEADGLATNYHDEGSGVPIVLIHGSGPGVTAWANWRLTIPPLSRGFRVLAPDITGFGYTQKTPDDTYDMDRWLGHLTGFLDAIGLDSVSVIGNSFGGALALALAVHHPDRVRRLVLMGAAGLDFELTPGLDAVWGYEPSLDNMRELIRLFAYDQSLASDDLVEMRYRASIRPGVQESYARMFPAPRQNGIRKISQDEDAIASLLHETLIVHGREDRVIPLSSSERLHQLIDRSQLHVFGRCGHWTQIEHCDRFVRLVGDFLAEERTAA
jgi:2-hydroxymuconate-semialdehyde hydrolase